MLHYFYCSQAARFLFQACATIAQPRMVETHAHAGLLLLWTKSDRQREQATTAQEP